VTRLALFLACCIPLAVFLTAALLNPGSQVALVAWLVCLAVVLALAVASHVIEVRTRRRSARRARIQRRLREGRL